MLILHFACIENNFCSGVRNVVPRYIQEQRKIASIGFININNVKINGVECQLEYKKNFCIEDLPAPFNKPELVVFQEAYRLPYLFIYRKLIKEDIPYIIVPHGELAEGAQRKKYFKKKIANFLLFNRFINRSLAIQCLSSTEMKHTNFKTRKIISTNGIDVPNEKKEHFSSEGVKIVYIGRLDLYHKGIDILLNAIALKRDYFYKEKCCFELYGPKEGRNKELIKNFIKKNDLLKIVKLHDAVFDEDKKYILLNADIFIQTSRFEGMPMGVLEALSYGLPCIVSEGTTLLNLVVENEAGWGCKCNKESVFQALLTMIEDRNKWKSKSDNARALVEEKFDWTKVTEKTVNKYRKCVKKYNAGMR